jgi:hypothetical protein
MSENRVLRKILRLKRKEVARDYCIKRSLITCTLTQILLGNQINEDEMGRA